MAILGKIRRHTLSLILIIGMALFAFVISGILDTGGQNGNAPNKPVGSVNGEELNSSGFFAAVQQTASSYGVSTLYAANLVWEEALRSLLFKQAFEKLGIEATKEQLEALIMTNENIVRNPEFQDENGFFDLQRFTDFIALLKVENPAAYQSWQVQEQNIAFTAKQQVYFNLLGAALTPSRQNIEAAYHFERDKVNFSYVHIDFNFIPDSIINITPAEIAAYKKKNSKQFTREVASCNLRFVLFEDKASPEDEENIRNRLESLKDYQVIYNEATRENDTLQGFGKANNISDFVSRHSEQLFDSIYKPKESLPSAFAERLFNLKNGEMIGPYKDGNTFKLSKMMGKKAKGSIRASHILVAYRGASGAANTVIRTEAQAKEKANQLLRLVKRNPRTFGQLAKKESDDPASAGQNGDLGFFQETSMDKNIFDFANKTRVNAIGLVKTDFGYHVVKITDKKPVVLIADIVEPIFPSVETSNEVLRKATEFEVLLNEGQSFAVAANSKGYNVQNVQNIKPLTEEITGLSRQREIVKWAFANDTKYNATKRFNLATGGYAIVQLTKKFDEGIQPTEEVANEIKQALTREKKVELIKKKFATHQTLESVAQTSDSLQIETAFTITRKTPVLPKVGEEPAVVGAAFALNPNQVSDFVEGRRGVFLVRLDKKEVATMLENYDEYSDKIVQERLQNVQQDVFRALKAMAEVQDNRRLYY